MSIYHFKILVPAAAAGRIIGKGGTTIAQLQRDAGARVKMSKASEFYPGTTERVCLISGPIEGILTINDFFMENFSSTSMKILVPNSTAGMIIGKCGSYIKQIKEESGAYVQISQKCTDLSLPERCVTIVGELDNIRRACAMILSKIVEDSATTTSNHYRDIRASSLTNGILSPSISAPASATTTTVATALTATTTSPTTTATTIAPTSSSSSSSSSSLTSSQSSTGSSSSSQSIANSNSHSHLLCSPPTAAPASLAPAPHLSLAAADAAAVSAAATTTTTTTAAAIATMMPRIRAPSVSPIVVPKSHSVTSEMNSDQIIESIKLVLRVSGYGEDAVSEITSAMSTLASYGVLGVGLGLL